MDMKANSVDKPIITSMLDQDTYKFSMGQLVFNQFPEAIVSYLFTNRGGTEFPNGFADVLKKQMQMMANLSLREDEKMYLQGIRFLKPTFVEWFANYRYNPDEVSVSQDDNGLHISIKGPWFRTIYWEVPLMALISELFFINREKKEGWENEIEVKAEYMNTRETSWIDFGTRRRASLEVHNEVVKRMKKYPYFRGTSNVHLAMVHNVKAHGTYAHELVMAMQAKYGPRESNRMAMDHWVKEFGGDLGIMLPDTLTTDVFLKGLSLRDAKLFDGPRLDSGDLISAGEKFIVKWEELGIDPTHKILVPSDSLTEITAVEFNDHFKGRVKGSTAGIGTRITNDVGFKPLNMVIKMSDADFGMGPVLVVKLSDASGKYTGDPAQISAVKQILGIQD